MTDNTQNERLDRLEKMVLKLFALNDLRPAIDSPAAEPEKEPIKCLQYEGRGALFCEKPADHEGRHRAGTYEWAEQIEGGAAGKVADDGESPGDCKVAPPSPVLSDEKVAELRANRPENWLNREAIALCDTAEELRRQLAEAWQAYAEVEQTNIDLTRERDEALADATRLRQNIWTMYAASCPGWASDGRIESMVANAVRFREGIEQERDEAHADGNGVQRALSMQLSAAEAKLDEATKSSAHWQEMTQTYSDRVETIGGKLDEARRLLGKVVDEDVAGAEVLDDIDAFLADKPSGQWRLVSETTVPLTEPTSPSPLANAEAQLERTNETVARLKVEYASPSPEVCGQWEMCEHDVYRSQHCPDCARPKAVERARLTPEKLDELLEQSAAGAREVHEKLERQHHNMDLSLRLDSSAKPPPVIDRDKLMARVEEARRAHKGKPPPSEHPDNAIVDKLVNRRSAGAKKVFLTPPGEQRHVSDVPDGMQWVDAKRLATLNVLARTCREHKAAGIRLPRGVLNALAALDATEPRHDRPEKP
jgi:hypothetical protein